MQEEVKEGGREEREREDLPCPGTVVGVAEGGWKGVKGRS